MASELEAAVFEFTDDDEDIHMAIERRLTAIAGPVGASSTPAARVTTRSQRISRCSSRESAERAVALTRRLMATLLAAAERHVDWPMPGYTHLQRAQPVYLSHHLLAYFWMLERDAHPLRFRTQLDDG